MTQHGAAKPPRLTVIDYSNLRAIGWPFAGAPILGEWADVWGQHPDSRPVRVVEQHRSGYIVADCIDQSFVIESLPEWQRPRLAPDQRPGVGDWVLITGNTDTLPQAVAMLARRSAIKRATAGEHYGQQIIAANIDTVFIVCGLDGDFNARRIERYLLLVRGGARPVVVLTKADTVTDDALDSVTTDALSALSAQGIEICRVDATDPASVSTLHHWLGPGQTAVLVGSSGAGKSTLTNTLVGHERMRTAAVRAADGRGRHTTTHRALISLPSGACLIDTPGMRELKPTGEEALSEGGFEDIEALAARCRFRDCRHEKEPGCAVRAAIETGQANLDRVANYLKLDGEVSGAAARRAAREAPRPGSRKISKAKQKRLDQRFGKE